MTVAEIGWVAGLLEGEGSFYHKGSPEIKVGMTDIDTIEKFRKITKTDKMKMTIITRDSPRKTVYLTRMGADLAIQWMMTIYSMMSFRRKERIRRIIAIWKDKQATLEINQKNYKRSKYNKMIKVLMAHHRVSQEEAEKLYEKMLGTIQ